MKIFFFSLVPNLFFFKNPYLNFEEIEVGTEYKTTHDFNYMKQEWFNRPDIGPATDEDLRNFLGKANLFTDVVSVF